MSAEQTNTITTYVPRTGPATATGTSYGAGDTEREALIDLRRKLKEQLRDVERRLENLQPNTFHSEERDRRKDEHQGNRDEHRARTAGK